MNGLIGNGVVVEMFHDVNLSPVWPLAALRVGQHPYCRPRPLRASQLRADLNLAVFYGALVACVETARDKACRVGCEVSVDATA